MCDCCLILQNVTHTTTCLGTGTGAMGRHTKNGGYKVDWNKVRTFVVPDLEGFSLAPYVSRKTPFTSKK
ncbi:unnamed protein product [Absidia cylindrospora]